MKLYLIGGLGADERVFKELKLNSECISINWIKPIKNEPLSTYVVRLKDQIKDQEDFGIVGVSFGGVVAVELNKIVSPKVTFLISSVIRSNQLPRNLVRMGKLGLLNVVPNFALKPPQFLFNYLFGAKNKTLLSNIIKDTEPEFIRWALTSITNWGSSFQPKNIVRIHGDNDKLIPLIGDAIKIQNGGHFMIVDNSVEISTIINEKLDTMR